MLRVTARQDSCLRCPVCHDGIGSPSLACTACRAAFHEECRTWLGRCATLACRGTIPLTIRVRYRARGAVRMVCLVALIVPPVLTMLMAVIVPDLIRARRCGYLAGHGHHSFKKDEVRVDESDPAYWLGPCVADPHPAELLWFRCVHRFQGTFRWDE